MCPDKQLLSAYCDGEVPSPWKESIRDHLARCPSCAGTLSFYRGIKESLREGPEQTGRPGAAAGPSRIFGPGGSLRPGGFHGLIGSPPYPFWKRRFSLTTAAALALGVLVFGAGAGLAVVLGPGRLLTESRAAGQAKPLDLTVKVKDVNQLLDILNRQELLREVTIRLPETRTFEFRGEPVFLRENEFFRGGAR